MKRLLLGLSLWLGLFAPAQAVIQQTYPGNAAYSILSTDVNLVTNAAFTASRTWTLPYAAATCIGQSAQCGNAMQIIDIAAAVTSTNTLVIAPQSGETINGSSASLTINYASARVILIPTSGSNWQAYISPANGQSKGTATNDNASAGNIGEYLTSTVTSGTTGGVVMASGTAMDVTLVVATAGDWDCRGNVGFITAGTTIATAMSTWTSSVSATAYAAGTSSGGAEHDIQTAAVTAPVWQLPVGTARYSLASSTSIYLSAKTSFSTAAASAFGFLGCRRVR